MSQLFTFFVHSGWALCTSAAGNFEERRFFNIPNPVSHAEVVYHANLIGICFTTTVMLFSGELVPALSHAATHTVGRRMDKMSRQIVTPHKSNTAGAKPF